MLLCFGKLQENPYILQSIIKLVLLFFISFINILAGLLTINLFSLLDIHGLTILSLKQSSLTTILLFTVLLVSSCVILNSIDYLSTIDSHLFLLYIHLFQLAMVMFILTHDLILSFLYWDILGIISYLLINFWSSRINCGIKAMIYNKIGDCSFILLLCVSYSYLTFINYSPFLSYSLVYNIFLNLILAQVFGYTMVYVILILICFTKSAQLPFSSWLLNAMSAPTPISALLHSSTMVIAGVIIGFNLGDTLVMVLESIHLFFISFFLFILLTLLWSLLNATIITDTKSIIAYSTVSQISYMFIALLINPLFTVYHIVIHAIFKSLLFILAGSLIHVNHHYQSTNKLKTKQTMIKIMLLFSGGVLIMAISKETIIHASQITFSSFYIMLLLVTGTIFTLCYTLILYLSLFKYSIFTVLSIFTRNYLNSNYGCLINRVLKEEYCNNAFYGYYSVFYSFILPFLLLTSIFLDVFLDYTLALQLGSLFYNADRCSIIMSLPINITFAILSTAGLLRFNYLYSSLKYSPCFQSSLFIPFYQDLLLYMSSYCIKSPANLIEIITYSSQCYNLWHIHYYNTIYMVWLLFLFLLVFIIH